MINIHVGDREMFVVSSQRSIDPTTSCFPFEDCLDMVEKIKEVVHRFFAEGNRVFVLTGYISIALDIKKNPVVSRSFYEIAQEMIKVTITSCLKPVLKKKVFNDRNTESAPLIPNASKLIQIGGKEFNTQQTKSGVKKLLQMECSSTDNPPSDARKRIISKALQKGGWVDALYQLNEAFYSKSEYMGGRFFVLREVDTISDEETLKARYLELSKLLAWKLPLPSQEDGFVFIGTPGKFFEDKQQ